MDGRWLCLKTFGETKDGFYCDNLIPFGFSFSPYARLSEIGLDGVRNFLCRQLAIRHNVKSYIFLFCVGCCNYVRSLHV
jgi:hypothetical protein